MKKPVVLMILDGWGIAPPSSTNAATKAQTPHLDFYSIAIPMVSSSQAVKLLACRLGRWETLKWVI